MDANHNVLTSDSSSKNSFEIAYEKAELFLGSAGVDIYILDQRPIRKALTVPHLQVSLNTSSVLELKNVRCSQILNRRRLAF